MVNIFKKCQKTAKKWPKMANTLQTNSKTQPQNSQTMAKTLSNNDNNIAKK